MSSNRSNWEWHDGLEDNLNNILEMKTIDCVGNISKEIESRRYRAELNKFTHMSPF